MVIADKVAVEAAPGLLAVIMLLSPETTLAQSQSRRRLACHWAMLAALAPRLPCPPLPPTSNLGMVYTPATQGPLVAHVRHLTQDGPGIAAALAEARDLYTDTRHPASRWPASAQMAVPLRGVP
jgi:hypothetical protein